MIKSARHVAVRASRQLLDHEFPDEQRQRIEAAAIAALVPKEIEVIGHLEPARYNDRTG